MKIIKAEGYEKPKYAVAVAAALVAATVSGCGVHYDGGISMGTPPEDEVILGGEATLPEPGVDYAGDISPAVDYDGGLVMYTEPDDEIQPEEDEADTTDPESYEIHETPEYCEPIDDDLVLSGSVEIYEP
ncbi:MAG: hypothetical protein K6F65_03160 [Lachnospiraceae bacterium]|nr:hypothetical protein [Lachnospiraceae bacterium]